MNRLYFVLMVCLVFFGCKNQNKWQHKAIIRAISFEASSSKIKETQQKIQGLSLHDANLTLCLELGSQNLSSFLLTANPESMTKYECEFNEANYIVIAQRFPFGKSLVQYKDISDILVIKTNSVWEGSFKYNIKNAFVGKCLYEMIKKDEDFIVSKLVIKHRKSSRIKDGFCVFSGGAAAGIKTENTD